MTQHFITRRQAITSLVLSLVFLGGPLVATAQEASAAEDVLQASAQYETPSELASCFQYYTFGSVPVSFNPSLHNVSAGAPIVFSGTITNNNTYPIVNADVWVKIFRQRSTTGEKDPNGPDVVDILKAAGPVTLKAGESQTISFTWQVPQGAQSGNYQAASYVVSSERFNLFGLTFTDDVTGSLTDFSVVGGKTGSVSFDKTSIKVADTPFYFAAYPPRVPAAGQVYVSGSVANTTDVPMKGTITWSLYSWDSLKPGALVEEETQEVKVHPHDSTVVSYIAKDTTHPVYYLVGTLTVGDTKSIVGIRFVRSDINTPRINFAGVTGYPLTEASTLFMCAHNTNDGEAADTAMTVAIVPTDPVERIVNMILGSTPTLTYTGAMPPQIVALAKEVKTSSKSFNVVARLYQNGVLVDEVTVPYICSALGVACGYSYSLIAASILLVAIILGALIMSMRKRRTNSLV